MARTNRYRGDRIIGKQIASGAIGRVFPRKAVKEELIPHIIQPKPLPDLELLDMTYPYRWTHHIIDRCEERKIGLYEVVATLQHPDQIRDSKNPLRKKYYRGDIMVIYEVPTKTIVTVASVNPPGHPRYIIQPQLSGESMAIADNLTKEQREKLRKAVTPDPEPSFEPVTERPVKRQDRRETTRIAQGRNARDCVKEWAHNDVTGEFRTASNLLAEYPELLTYYGSEKKALDNITAAMSSYRTQGILVKHSNRFGGYAPVAQHDTRKVKAQPPVVPSQTTPPLPKDETEEGEQVTAPVKDSEPTAAVEAATPLTHEPENNLPEPTLHTVMDGQLLGPYADRHIRKEIEQRATSLIGLVQASAYDYELNANRKRLTLVIEWEGSNDGQQ